MSAPPRFQPGVRWLAVAMGFLTLAVAPTPSSAVSARGPSVSLTLGGSAIYDDNLLQYSDAQLTTFDSGLKPDQFSLHSSDDLVLGPYAALTWENARARGRSRSVRVKVGGEFHKENGTADHRSYSATWRESFSRDNRLTISGFLLPGFYLRQLFDEDAVVAFPGLSKYRRAEFDLTIGSVAWRHRLGGRTRGELGYQYERRSYNPEFTERTSNTHQGDLDLEVNRLPSRGTVDVHGGYRVSRARAVDSDGFADDPDVSYHGVIAGAGWRMELARGSLGKLGGSLGYELGTRAYGSDLPSDKYHYRRHDVSNSVDAALRWALPSHWSVRGLYRFDHNSANLGTVAPTGSDAGSYTENQVGLSVEWSGPLWRRSKESSGQDAE